MRVRLTERVATVALTATTGAVAVKLLRSRRSGYHLNPLEALERVHALKAEAERRRQLLDLKAGLYAKPIKPQKGERLAVYGFVRDVASRYSTFTVDDEDDAVGAIAALTRLSVPPKVAYDAIRRSAGGTFVLSPRAVTTRSLTLIAITVRAEPTDVGIPKKLYPVVREAFSTNGDVVTTIAGFISPLVWYVLSFNGF